MDGFVPERGCEAQTEFIYCCGAVTELLKFGSCVPGCRLLFLIIPGESGCMDRSIDCFGKGQVGHPNSRMIGTTYFTL